VEGMRKETRVVIQMTKATIQACIHPVHIAKKITIHQTDVGGDQT